MKRPEEIKKGLECCTDGNFTCMQCPYRDLAPDCSKALRADYRALFQQLEAQVPRWVPVTERLPEDGKDVLVLIRGIVDVGFHFAQYGWETYTMRTVGITHWMPLPEPPKEVQHEP